MPSKVKEKENIWPARAQRKCIWSTEQCYKTSLLSGMPTRLSDELPKKTNSTIIFDVQEPFIFSAPPLKLAAAALRCCLTLAAFLVKLSFINQRSTGTGKRQLDGPSSYRIYPVRRRRQEHVQRHLCHRFSGINDKPSRIMLEQAMQGHIIGQYELAGLSKEKKRTRLR
jgi:hypothetical protein